MLPIWDQFLQWITFDLFWTVMTLGILVDGLIALYIDSPVVPQFMRTLLLFGKFGKEPKLTKPTKESSTKESSAWVVLCDGINSVLKKLEVPKSWFRHFYIYLELTTKLLIGDTRIAGFMLMKHFFVFLYAEDVRRLNTPELRNFIKNFLLLLDNQKYEFLLELAVYILKNDQVLLSEKPYLVDLRNDMEKRIRRVNWTKAQTMLRQTYQLYEEYLEFIEWKTQNDPRNIATFSVQSSINSNSYMSSVLEHLSNRIKDNLNRLVSNNRNVEMNLDIGVLMLLQLYDNDNELIEALELLERYAMSNPDNMNAHIYIVEFLARFPDIPHDYKIRINALQNIVRLCPDSRYTLRLVKEQPQMNVKEMIGGCIVCGEEQISDENSLIYCDGPCGHGFHQGKSKSQLLAMASSRSPAETGFVVSVSFQFLNRNASYALRLLEASNRQATKSGLM
ncbi:Protein AF-10 [Tyrophagus putrescentiae]|nr:Protein AF-10 [Tyrophagus putrescentiae]